MVSNTQQTERRRQRKARRSGAARKRALAKKGTTPKFPIHPEGSTEKKES